jgi:hypothetical protein
MLLKRKKMMKNRYIFSVAMLAIFTLVKGYSQPSIEKIKDDLLINQDSILMPVSAINALWDRNVNYIEFKEYLLVHAVNKNWIYDPSIEMSAVIIYKKIDTKWKLVNVFPFYSNLELLNKTDSLFISDNSLCDMEGKCKSLISILKFSCNELKELTFHEGFNNVFYMENYFTNDKLQALKEFIGDTIAKDIVIDNIKYSSDKSLEYRIIIDNEILIGVFDTLTIKRTKQMEIIKKHY